MARTTRPNRVLDLLLEDLDDDLALGRLTLVNRQATIILEKIGKLEFGDAQNVGFQRAAN